jgi:hypothetical protein
MAYEGLLGEQFIFFGRKSFAGCRGSDERFNKVK